MVPSPKAEGTISWCVYSGSEGMFSAAPIPATRDKLLCRPGNRSAIVVTPVRNLQNRTSPSSDDPGYRVTDLEEGVMAVWDAFLTEQDREHMCSWGKTEPKGFGAKPAVLVIDDYYSVLGLERLPIMESIEKWP